MRKLALTLVPLILLRSTSVFALGVGDIELHSALNQPLNAEIRLLSATPAEIQGLTVALAPEAAFARAGVDRLTLLNQLRFKVVQKPNGSYSIKVTSTQPIREPFLDFLVEVNWPTGRFIREYTVLLDFPVLEGSKPAPIDAPVTPSPTKSPDAMSMPDVTPSGAAITEPEAENIPPVTGDAKKKSEASASPAAAITPRKQTQQVTSQATAQSDGRYGPTQRSDTLWDIALKMRPDPSLSPAQIMVALAKNNPQAFFGDNVNNLMAGYILRLPPTDQIRAIPKDNAVREIAEQYQQWLNVPRGSMAIPSTSGASSETAEDGPQSDKRTPSAQLKLATPGTGTANVKTGVPGGHGKPSPDDSSDVAALRKELTIALEAVDANRQQNAELRSRMAQLEQQLASMKRLLELKDGNLAAMQNNNTAAPAATQSAGTPAQPATSAPLATTATPTATPTEPQEETDLLGTLMGNPQQLGLLIGGFLLISALAWAIVRRRRQSAIDSADESFAKLLKNSSVTSEAETKHQGNDTSSVVNAAADIPPVEPELPATVMAMSSAQTDEDMIDPLAEADVYLAYKRYEQAAELIKDAIRNDPTRPDLSLKLLEIYHLGKNADAFETQAESLYAELSGDSNHPLWAKAVEMGKQTAPTHPLFSKAMVTTLADNMDMDIPDVVSEHLTPPTDDSFSLDAPQEFSAMDARDTEASLAAATDNSIDFDLSPSLSYTASEILTENTSDKTETETPPPLPNTMDFDLSLSDDIDNLNGTVNNGPNDSPTHQEEDPQPTFTSELPLPSAQDENVLTLNNNIEFDHYDREYGTQNTTTETTDTSAPVAFNLDAPEITAFDGTAPDESTSLEKTVSDTEESFFDGIDIVGTKLDLAKAYIDMEDKEGARMLLNEVLKEGSTPQKNEAQELMQQIS